MSKPVRVFAGRVGAALCALLLLAGAGVAPAQIDEPSECVQQCLEQEQQCIDACDQRPDPVECEATCRDRSDQCQQECRER